MENKIHVIMTGGTIDSEWDDAQDAVVVSEHSNIPAYFKKLGMDKDCIFTEICMKDSRALTEEDLKKLVKIIEASPAKKILITHGLFTMPDTVKFLETNLKHKDQTIILVGSISPLKGFAMSDAPYNIGYAVAKLSELKSGIYSINKSFLQD